MAYVAVKGGETAIDNSIELLTLSRGDGGARVEPAAMTARMKRLLDRVMCEAGLYAPEYAALALKQSEGCPEEAVFLLRAYRSTLPRSHVSRVADCLDMRLTRRISSAFKDIPSGQLLGASYDYTHRLLDFSLAEESESDLQAKRERIIATTRERIIASHADATPADATPAAAAAPDMRARRVSDLLKDEGLIKTRPICDNTPDDITRDKLTLPASRSARLQTLFRADTGFVCGVAYAGLRGYGFSAHPTIGELRRGYVEVEIPYPPDESESVVLGEIMFTEVEAFVSSHTSRDDREFDELGAEIGYGLAFGRAETKAIAMSILDCALDHPGQTPPNDEEFVLLHGESTEMSGFISHLKLPHYVTFQSKLDNARRTGQNRNSEETGDGNDERQ
ncbi:MAG: carbon-phosphorus lyase complex subunit PhnI [Oscillospiraceae bacterium]|jgi:alpha-D-ribose 1-methylphosphonate 5-triphosphate synthase subunit PhnI|nr:carbon-phosphorus lyase complex subunit PhnI [Oscillospiraceae bacterium]